MKLVCEGQEIRPRLDISEKNAMLIIGGSRCGKSVFMFELAQKIIEQGNVVYAIDLGEKWTHEAKERFYSARSYRVEVESQGINLTFASVNELIGSAKVIANAIGFQSVNAKIALKKVFQKLICHREKVDFTMEDILNVLKNDMKDAPESEWSAKIFDRLDILGGSLPDIRFSVTKHTIYAASSILWDLSGVDDEYTQIIADLKVYALLCEQKRIFKAGRKPRNIFLIIDEFQNLSCNKTSIIGKCLTEGQKYHLYMILATQFLDANFSEAVINQFKQGGFRFYFRLTEEEARSVSRQMAYDYKTREEIYKQLISLPVGSCLMIGPHSIGKCNEVVERYRFVKVQLDEIKEEKTRNNSKNNEIQKKKCVAVVKDKTVHRTPFEERGMIAPRREKI